MPQPLEMILARNLISNLVTPALLIDSEGSVALYNIAAGVLVGRQFEETGSLNAQEWTQTFQARDADGRPLSPEHLPMIEEVEHSRPAQGRFRFRSAQGKDIEVDMTAVPLVGEEGWHGAMVFLCPVGEPIPAEIAERIEEVKR